MYVYFFRASISGFVTQIQESTVNYIRVFGDGWNIGGWSTRIVSHQDPRPWYSCVVKNGVCEVIHWDADSGFAASASEPEMLMWQSFPSASLGASDPSQPIVLHRHNVQFVPEGTEILRVDDDIKVSPKIQFFFYQFD